jgi:hypothetical protein
MSRKLPMSTWRTGILLTVGVLSFLGYQALESQEFEPGLLSTGMGEIGIIQPPQSFTISADPAVEVLWMEARGGSSNETTTYVLYGDGSLTRTHSWAPGESRTQEIQLDFTEARDLVDLAVQGSLMEWDRGNIENQIAQSAGRVPSWTGSRVFELRIALESYSGSPEGPGEPMTKTIVTQSVGFLRHKVPNVREIAAFDDLVEVLGLYFQSEEGNE